VTDGFPTAKVWALLRGRTVISRSTHNAADEGGCARPTGAMSVRVESVESEQLSMPLFKLN
jgi:hypothetical protein